MDDERIALVVEDSLPARRLLNETLSQMGFSVDEATNGQEAIEKIESRGVDKVSLIVADLMMPVMNGVEFIVKIKQDYAICPPIIV